MNFNEVLKVLNEGKNLKKTDVKATEHKMEKEVVDMLDGNEINFINNFLKKGEKIDGKMIKSIDVLIKKYKAKIGQSRIKSDGNLLMLAPLIAAMYSEIQHN